MSPWAGVGRVRGSPESYTAFSSFTHLLRLPQGKTLIGQGRYRHATEILDKLVHAEPKNQEARDLLADAFEQLGYQSESPSLRNRCSRTTCR